jgi:hypothetical protein
VYRAVANRNNGRCRQRRVFEMIDSWTKQSPSGKTVTFKIEGDRKSGFVYSAKMDRRDIQEIKGFLEELPREGVEVLFANYVAGK